MPIRPENKVRYPADWQHIRLQILNRARYRCEHPGCGAVHRALGYWRDEKWVPLPRALRDAGVDRPCSMACADGSTVKVIRIVLTIAHIDHQPENCEPSNLRAWCQRHHLAYDAEHHKHTRHQTRRAAARTVDMFEETSK
ncbi:hypothetical protein [Thauera butanivorans]|uniref:hypothetical protein n=1 Tax=Thauera butanivorans TaxID=86174 RepID=UPI0008395534|nr:hypothetical protein [Thauera butanivorans]